VVVSKYLAIEAHRKAYVSTEHDDPETRTKAVATARTLDWVLAGFNYSAGIAFLAGALLTVLHVLTV